MIGGARIAAGAECLQPKGRLSDVESTYQMTHLTNPPIKRPLLGAMIGAGAERLQPNGRIGANVGATAAGWPLLGRRLAAACGATPQQLPGRLCPRRSRGRHRHRQRHHWPRAGPDTGECSSVGCGEKQHCHPHYAGPPYLILVALC